METFNTATEALEWIETYINETMHDHCVDNFRFAFLDDPEGMKVYNEHQDNGCCGAEDIEVMVNGRKGVVGCNYGH